MDKMHAFNVLFKLVRVLEYIPLYAAYIQLVTYT